MNWATYLKYLQVVVKEFYTITTLNKNLLIQNFRDSPNFFIDAQLNKQNKDLKNW